MKRILITGSAGFVGSHLVEHVLANTDWHVIGIDSFRHRGDSLRIFQDPSRYEIYTHDLTTPISDRLIKKIGRVDYIINMASESHVDRSITDPVLFCENNFKLVLNVLEYARKARPKTFIQISTDEVYGAALQGHNHKEWETVLPSNPYCLHPDSLVLTDSGYKRIEDIDIFKDSIFGRKSSNQICTKYQPLNKFKYKYKGKMLKIRTRTQEIICSPEHRLFYQETFFSSDSQIVLKNKKNNVKYKGARPHVKINEIRAKDVKINDKIVVIKKIKSIQEKEFDNDFCRFLGYFLGDGSYSKKSKYVRLADEKKDYLEYYKNILEKYLGVSPKASTNNFGNIYKHESKNCWYLQFASEKLRNQIDLNQENRNKLAKYMFKASDENVSNFLAGFFDADSHYKYEDNLLVSIEIYQAKKETLDDVKALLTKIGIVCRVVKDSSKRGFNLSITDSKSLQECLNIPSFKLKQNTSFRKPQRQNIRSKNVKWDHVIDIEEIDYDGFIYDLEMPHGNYIANGLLVHNSGSKAAQEAMCISYWRTYSVPVIITNTMNMVGERQDSEKFLPMLIKKINAGKSVIIHGSEKCIGSRFYLHARNHADALLFLLNNTIPTRYKDSMDTVIKPDRYNIVGDVEIDNLELARMVAGILDKNLYYNLLDFHAARPGHDRRYALDGSKLKQLGWRAPISFKQTLKKTISWTLGNKEWLQ